MPVSQTKSCTEGEWTGIFEHMIKPAVTGSRLGYDCERAKPLTGAFIRDILEGLNRADVVIADLSDRNPNVCYELGIRHTLKKRTILIAQNMNDVPSDLQSYWVVTYEKDLTGADKFKRRVREILREMHENPQKSDSPVADFLGLKNIDILSYEKSANLRKLSALISETSQNLDNCDVIVKQVKNKSKVGVSPTRFSNACLELLLSTSYITFPKPLPQMVQLTNEMIKLINKHLDLAQEPTFRQEAQKRVKKSVVTLRNSLSTLLQEMGEIRTNYANDNYQEPKEPSIILSRTEHEKYLRPIE